MIGLSKHENSQLLSYSFRAYSSAFQFHPSRSPPPTSFKIHIPPADLPTQPPQVEKKGETVRSSPSGFVPFNRIGFLLSSSNFLLHPPPTPPSPCSLVKFLCIYRSCYIMCKLKIIIFLKYLPYYPSCPSVLVILVGWSVIIF